MASFFKKALGVFVEIEENTKESPVTTNHGNGNPKINNTSYVNLSQVEIDKFENHFDKLFDQSNLPGPDYYEFCKMLETLESHIPDEKTRMSAVYASLSIQGLTKQTLLQAADHYKGVLLADKNKFENAIGQKSQVDLESRKSTLIDLEKKIVESAELIKNLTKDITESQVRIASLKEEIKQEEKKLSSNMGGYRVAYDAMMNKINTDIEKIQVNL